MEKTKKSGFWQSAVIGIKLLRICAIVAAVVAFVYDLTLEKANANIMGVIFNGIEQMHAGYYGKYYSRKYYERKKK